MTHPASAAYAPKGQWKAAQGNALGNDVHKIRAL